MASTSKILIISEQLLNEKALLSLLKKLKLDVTQVNSNKLALEAINATTFDAVLCDIEMPKINKSILIDRCPKKSVVFLSHNPDLRQAIEVIQRGAADYLAQPVELDRLQQVISQILQTNNNIPLIGNSPQIIKIATKIRQMAKRVSPILIIGEPGSGKRKIVREMHQSSPFFCYPLIMIDCASVTQQQLSKELDTDNQKTLYYHNICELNSSLQKVVASSLNNKKIRTIASTEKDLTTATALKLFREDLLYKLSSITINIPPLRERKSDILLLARHFLSQYAKKRNRDIKLTANAIKALNACDWPGNVIQLKESIRQALIFTNSEGIIDAPSLSLPQNNKSQNMSTDRQRDLPNLSLEDYFIHFVTQNQEHMSETTLAKILGISRKSLWQRRIKLKLDKLK
ncbi:sigma 54-interacting transcriptional regulator [Porticoccaceae bacterium]|nr:sigma 54-interacting transcriptional regulator [Porticoccaceae bacterium]